MYQMVAIYLLALSGGGTPWRKGDPMDGLAFHADLDKLDLVSRTSGTEFTE